MCHRNLSVISSRVPKVSATEGVLRAASFPELEPRCRIPWERGQGVPSGMLAIADYIPIINGLQPGECGTPGAM